MWISGDYRVDNQQVPDFRKSYTQISTISSLYSHCFCFHSYVDKISGNIGMNHVELWINGMNNV